MIFPQFSLRTLLVLTAVAAMVAWVLSQAVAGAAWALAATWGMAFAVVLFAAYATLFLSMWLVGVIVRGILDLLWPDRGGTPFASTATPVLASSSPVVLPASSDGSHDVTPR